MIIIIIIIIIIGAGAGRAVGEIILGNHGGDGVGDAFVGFVFGPELVGRRKRAEGDIGFDSAAGDGAVVKAEAVAVAAENEGDVEDMGVAEGLLEAGADRVGVILGLNDGDGDVRLVIEDVVGALLGTASVDFSPHINAPVGETYLFAYLRVEVPRCGHERRGDELGADVAFGEGFFVHRGGVSAPGVIQQALGWRQG